MQFLYHKLYVWDLFSNIYKFGFSKYFLWSWLHTPHDYCMNICKMFLPTSADLQHRCWQIMYEINFFQTRLFIAFSTTIVRKQCLLFPLRPWYCYNMLELIYNSANIIFLYCGIFDYLSLREIVDEN